MRGNTISCHEISICIAQPRHLWLQHGLISLNTASSASSSFLRLHIISLNTASSASTRPHQPQLSLKHHQPPQASHHQPPQASHHKPLSSTDLFNVFCIISKLGFTSSASSSLFFGLALESSFMDPTDVGDVGILTTDAGDVGYSGWHFWLSKSSHFHHFYP